MDVDLSGIDIGAKNLLQNCGEMTPGSSLLIIHEPAALGYYDDHIAGAVERVARSLDLTVETIEVPFNPVVADPGPDLSNKMAKFDRVLFFARLGDQLRFRPSGKDNYAIMSYALDRDMLGSSFGQADYHAFETLKTLVNRAFSSAKDIHVTCPEGTDFRGPGANFPPEDGDTTVKRFPLSVFTPIPPVGFSGRVAQVGFLASTGSQTYEPPACEITEKIFVHFEGHGITNIEGSARDVAAAQAHYDHVAGLFDLERDYIHSWHAGIHPGCVYSRPPSAYFDRWSNGAFGNPRIMHFHTCGRHAPGEISLNVIDPTIRLDGVSVWAAGRLHPERIEGGQALLDSDDFLADLFANPVTEIGLGPSQKLRY